MRRLRSFAAPASLAFDRIQPLTVWARAAPARGSAVEVHPGRPAVHSTFPFLFRVLESSGPQRLQKAPLSATGPAPGVVRGHCCRYWEVARFQSASSVRGVWILTKTRAHSQRGRYKLGTSIQGTAFRGRTLWAELQQHHQACMVHKRSEAGSALASISRHSAEFLACACADSTWVPATSEFRAREPSILAPVSWQHAPLEVVVHPDGHSHP